MKKQLERDGPMCVFLRPWPYVIFKGKTCTAKFTHV